MADDTPFLIDLPVQTVALQKVEPSLKEWFMRFGTPSQAGVVKLILGARDGSGEFNPAVGTVERTLVDRPELDGNPDPQLAARARVATALMEALFDAVLPENDTTKALGLAGITVREAGKLLLSGSLLE